MTNPFPITTGTTSLLEGQVNKAKHPYHGANLYSSILQANDATHINHLLPVRLSISLSVPAGQSLRAELVGGPEQTVIWSSYHRGSARLPV